MSRSHTGQVLLLTLVYLVVELAFNARLLDVTGSLDPSDTGQLETYGRALSGIAVALFVLQCLLGRRDRSEDRTPGRLSIVVRCLIAGLMTVFFLKWVTVFLVENSSGDFRKAAVNLVMLRTELVAGRALLAKKADRLEDFSGPDGKAFAALFPAMGAMMWPRLDDRLTPIKRQVFSNAINARLGGAEQFYKNIYGNLLFPVRQLFLGRIPEAEFQNFVRKNADRIWSDYEDALHKRGWRPGTVPYLARKRVWAYMNERTGVPRGWLLNDRAGMERSLAIRLRKQLEDSPGTLIRDGKVVAKGLSWSQFVAHADIQQSLQHQLDTRIRVRGRYNSGAQFERLFYKPLVAERVARELERLKMPAREFATGGRFEDEGRKAAEAVLVPPIALFCSLLGAMAHIAKLLYLWTRMPVTSGHAARYPARTPALVPVVGMGLMLWGTVVGDTPLTQGAVHQFMREQIVSNGGLDAQVMFTAMHMVEVGQYYSWPITDSIRKSVLRGYEFR